MGWRWQVVTGESRVNDAVSPWAMLCEVWLDKHDRLEGWSEPMDEGPCGNDLTDLRGELVRMLTETLRWKPVRFEDLQVGMKFERVADTQPPPEDDNTWLIVKRDLYYRPGGHGYTGIRDEAGRYTLAEAKAHESPDSGVSIVKLSEAPEFTRTCWDDLARKHLAWQRNQARRRLEELALMIVAAHESADSAAGIPLHVYARAKESLAVGNDRP